MVPHQHVFSLYVLSEKNAFNILNHTSAVMAICIREWSLITGRGGLQNGRGGHMKFYPYEKGGRKKF